MNIQECDILNTLQGKPFINQRILSEESGHSLGVVNRSLKNLEREGYLDEKKGLTERADLEFKERAPRNAVILADGFGMRMGPDSAEIPKGLLEVKGEVLIERTLRQLHEVGIQEIYVIVGFLKERYEYLADAYGVELVVNPDYALDSTLYSLSLVLPYLSNTYIIPCGVWCGRNPYHRHELYSWYMVSDSTDKESAVRVNRKRELVSAVGQTGGNAVVGIAYLLEEQAAVASRRIKEICGKGNEKQGELKRDEQHGGQVLLYKGHKQCGEPGTDEIHERCKGYEQCEENECDEGHKKNERRSVAWPEVDVRTAWETVLLEKDRMIVWARVAYGTDAVGIRRLAQLHKLEAGLNCDNLEIKAFAACSKFFGRRPDKLLEITPSDKGMTGRSFLVFNNGRSYVVWMPGEGIRQMVNPERVAWIYDLVSKRGICDAPVYINSEDGCRITDFLEETKTCDPRKTGDLEKCMAFLRDVHGIRGAADYIFDVEHEFETGYEIDLFGLITFYEELWEGKPSLYKDYSETKEGVFSLKFYIDIHRMENALVHMDAAPNKFLFLEKENGEKVQLEGWEYAGIQDPHVDIAIFCINALYDKACVDRLISIYFSGSCLDETRIKIYCYIAVCGLLRSNWCEYRMKSGEEFGEYSLCQYRYAKEYYRIAWEELWERDV